MAKPGAAIPRRDRHEGPEPEGAVLPHNAHRSLPTHSQGKIRIIIHKWLTIEVKSES